MVNSARTTTVFLAWAGSAAALVAKDGVSGRLPALGWNSWNAYRCDIDADKILRAALDLQMSGLQDRGYNYVNLDDCWSDKDGRDPDTGRLLPNMTRFPEGIRGLAERIHDMGFQIGIYGDAGDKTCAGYPGSLYHEELDAETWADWGIDYLKYDNCNVPASWPPDEYHSCHPDYNQPTGPNGTCINDPQHAPPGYNWASSSTARRFRRMTDALEAQNRTLLYSLCEWGQAAVQTWGNATGMSWRMTDDIFPDFALIKHIINYNQFRLHAVNFWGHNDADMLEIGNGDLTLAESRTHFALWAVMKSPLLIGTDVGALSDALLDILRNPYLLAFNQDPVVGAPAMPYRWGAVPDWTYSDEFPAEYWSGRYGNGDTLVVITNYAGERAEMSAEFAEIPGLSAHAEYTVTDAWTGEEVGCRSGGYTFELEPNDSQVLVISEGC